MGAPPHMCARTCACTYMHTCVTPAGLGALLPVLTLGCTVSDTGMGRKGRNDDSVWDGYRILLLIEWAGTHSPHWKVEGLVLSVLINY